MKRYFKCLFVRKDALVVCLDTDETGPINDRVLIPDEVGRDPWGMEFEECNEITEEQARNFHPSGKLEEIDKAALAEPGTFASVGQILAQAKAF